VNLLVDENLSLRGLVTNHGAHQTQSVLRRNQFAPKLQQNS
jgi:hypothetical protein